MTLPKKIAAIDIGTNSILLVIKDLTTDEILEDISRIAGLGKGMEPKKMIVPDAVERALKILKEYKATIEKYNVCKTKVTATSCMREAANQKDVKDMIKNKTGFRVEVITGEREAELTYRGSVGNHDKAVLIDIGGGSTEIIDGQSGRITFKKSLPMGVIRFTERYVTQFPVIDQEYFKMKTNIENELKNIAVSQTHTLIAPAGTPTSLAAWDQNLKYYDRSKIDGHRLSLKKIRNFRTQLFAMNTHELKAIPGINPARATLIPAGTLILETAAEKLGFKKVIVSAKGLRYGVLKTMQKSLEI